MKSLILENLKAIEELKEMEVFDEVAYQQARLEALEELFTKQKVSWKEYIPNIDILISLGVFAAVMAFTTFERTKTIPKAIALGVSVSAVTYIIIIYFLRKRRIEKAQWSISKREFELSHLRKEKKISQEEYEDFKRKIKKLEN